ncbi:putative HTH-type transcriptional regulator [Mesorhizobium phage Cp1R7A-A1]|nr:putative HTH-type transcriptional regulator [Mesorhizobium phage Cp1R7A-A1]
MAKIAVVRTNEQPEPKATKPTMDREGCIAFGKRLAEARENAGMSQSELSRMLAISRSAVGQWELGNTYPAVDNVRRIADAVRVSPEYLLFGISNSNPQRLVDSIPLIDRINGKEHVVTSVMLPKDFISRAGLTGLEKMRAVTVFNDGEIDGVRRGDIAIVNTEDKDISGKGRFVLDNHKQTSLGTAQAVPGTNNKRMQVTITGDTFELPVDKLPIVGRIVATLRLDQIYHH